MTMSLNSATANLMVDQLEVDNKHTCTIVPGQCGLILGVEQDFQDGNKAGLEKLQEGGMRRQRQSLAQAFQRILTLLPAAKVVCFA